MTQSALNDLKSNEVNKMQKSEEKNQYKKYLKLMILDAKFKTSKKMRQIIKSLKTLSINLAHKEMNKKWNFSHNASLENEKEKL